MHIGVEIFEVQKRFPLTISRGTTAQTTNLWLRVEQDGIEGWGEASPFSLGSSIPTRDLAFHPNSTLRQSTNISTETLKDVLQQLAPALEAFSPLEQQRISQVLQEAQVPSSARAALDVALHDWLGKRVGLPLWQLWGLDRSRIVPTSVTIGINSPEMARARVRDWLTPVPRESLQRGRQSPGCQSPPAGNPPAALAREPSQRAPSSTGGTRRQSPAEGDPPAALAPAQDWLHSTDVRILNVPPEAAPAARFRRLKVKLGSPSGIEADQAMLMAVQQEAPALELYVDANGGWSLDDAIVMCRWLADRDVRYVEQPLATGEEARLAKLKAQSPLPIFVDESCLTSRDIPHLADNVHGINIKLMKAGGLTEAMRMVHTARAYGLQVMFGCYSDSSLANTAAAHLSPLADYLDLDSHLNLLADPFTGAVMEAGRLLPNEQPGLGVQRSAAYA